LPVRGEKKSESYRNENRGRLREDKLKPTQENKSKGGAGNAFAAGSVAAEWGALPRREKAFGQTFQVGRERGHQTNPDRAKKKKIVDGKNTRKKTGHVKRRCRPSKGAGKKKAHNEEIPSYDRDVRIRWGSATERSQKGTIPPRDRPKLKVHRSDDGETAKKWKSRAQSGLGLKAKEMVAVSLNPKGQLMGRTLYWYTWESVEGGKKKTY